MFINAHPSLESVLGSYCWVITGGLYFVLIFLSFFYKFRRFFFSLERKEQEDLSQKASSLADVSSGCLPLGSRAG